MENTRTSSRLVEVATRLFHTNGYAATGVARILKEAEAGSGSLYHFYPTKEDLLRSVLECYRERLEEEIFRPVRERFSDPIDRVFGVLGFYREFLEQSDCSLGCPIGNLAGELSDSHPASRAELARLFEAWREGIASFLDEGKGRFVPGTDLDALSTLVLSVMEGAVMQARVARSLEPFEQSVSMLRDYFDRLLSEEPASAESRSSSSRRRGVRRRKR